VEVYLDAGQLAYRPAGELTGGRRLAWRETSRGGAGAAVGRAPAAPSVRTGAERRSGPASQ